jgi:hypothetical protein
LDRAAEELAGAGGGAGRCAVSVSLAADVHLQALAAAGDDMALGEGGDGG